MKASRVLVTGHNGYIGSIVAPFLAARGHEVVGLDTDFYVSCTLGPAPRAIPNLRKDIRDVTPDDLRGFDAVVHLAALSNDPIGEINPDLTYEINHRGSVRLAEAAKQAGVRRFLFSSSCSMYGAAGEGLVGEEAPLRPLTPYAISKVRTESDLGEMADDRFSPVFLRNATVYGMSPRLRADLVVNNLLCWAFTTGKIRILSDGTPWRPVVHVEDVAQAFALALESPTDSVHNVAFNVGSEEENYQVRDLASFVHEAVPDCGVEYAEGGGPDPRSYQVDFGKIGKILPGFHRKRSVRDGVTDLLGVFRRNGMTLEDFQEKFTRLAHLRNLIETKRLNGSFRWNEEARA